MYRYTNMSGERQVEYSWRLVESDPQPQGRKRELSLREKEALIEQDKYDMISTSYGSMTVNELSDFYVKMKQKRGKITVRTIENYTKIWNKNMRKRKFAGMQIQAVRKTHILDCYQEMLGDGVGNGSITLIHKVLSAMFNMLFLKTISVGIMPTAVPKNLAFTITKAMHALKKQKEYMLKHGMLKNFMMDSHSGFVFLTKRFQLWSAAQLDIILHRIVYDYNSIEVANAIIEDREPELLPNITAHILRHTACTRMAEAGMEQRTLQEIMGHSNLAITMKVYNHADDKRMRDEIEKFDAKRDGKSKV